MLVRWVLGRSAVGLRFFSSIIGSPDVIRTRDFNILPAMQDELEPNPKGRSVSEAAETFRQYPPPSPVRWAAGSESCRKTMRDS